MASRKCRVKMKKKELLSILVTRYSVLDTRYSIFPLPHARRLNIFQMRVQLAF